METWKSFKMVKTIAQICTFSKIGFSWSIKGLLYTECACAFEKK